MVFEGNRKLPIIGQLPENWSIAVFGSTLIDGTRNGIYKPKEFHGRGVKIVNMGELFSNPRLYDIPMKRLELSEKEMTNYLLERGDLLFARRSLVAEGAGKCSIVCNISEPTTYESSIIRARPDPRIANALFLYYLFNSPYGRYILQSIRRQVAVAGITGKDLVEQKIPLPPLPEQRTIVRVLGTFDDKIELNRRMNATLEAMARAIFKSWFVDFDPVRAKMEGEEPVGMDAGTAALFPEEFEEVDGREVPVGWRGGSLTDVVDILGGGTPKTTIEKYWGGQIPWFSVVDAPDTTDVFAIDTERRITELALNDSSARILPVGTTIITARGTVGKTALTAVPMAMNQSCYGLSGKDGYEPLFTYYLTRSVVSILRQNVHGSVFDTITRQTLKNTYVTIPPKEVCEAFERQVGPLLKSIESNVFESRTLTALRDTLLPKLISGEIQIPMAREPGKEEVIA